MNAVTQPDRDAELEIEIDAAYDAMIAAKTDEESTAYFKTMARLIARRSPYQIQKMEIARRIAMRAARQ